ncbi:hypothetical protein BC829DRAFT_192524 [Chytridium lagenaria]|nr:hypothetical protein BC829DRAFT_192524 [Chytridium lagenaria]
MDPVEPASLSIAVDTVISGSISTSSPLSPIPQASTVSTTAPAPSAAPPQKKKGGFRGMLSSLTKSRPKAARKASGKNDNDESVPDQSSTSVLEVSDSQNIIEGQEGRYSVDTTKESVKDEDSAEPAKIDLSLPVIPTTSSLLDEISDSRKVFIQKQTFSQLLHHL